MNIQRAARESGLTADTIRFYEKTGVLPPAPRLGNGYRYYTDDHLATLRLARGLRDLDVPLSEVADLVQVAHDAECGDVKAVLLARLDPALASIDDRIDDLRRTRARIAELVGALRGMPEAEGEVPGVDACGCVEAVGRLA